MRMNEDIRQAYEQLTPKDQLVVDSVILSFSDKDKTTRKLCAAVIGKIEFDKNKVGFPLVHSESSGSLNLTNERIDDVLTEEDAEKCNIQQKK